MSFKDISTDELWAKLEQCLDAEDGRECISPASTLVKPVRVVTLVQHETKFSEKSSPCPPGSVHLNRARAETPRQAKQTQTLNSRLEAYLHQRDVTEEQRYQRLLARIDSLSESRSSSRDTTVRGSSERQQLASLISELRARVNRTNTADVEVIIRELQEQLVALRQLVSQTTATAEVHVHRFATQPGTEHPPDPSPSTPESTIHNLREEVVALRKLVHQFSYQPEINTKSGSSTDNRFDTAISNLQAEQLALRQLVEQLASRPDAGSNVAINNLRAEVVALRELVQRPSTESEVSGSTEPAICEPPENESAASTSSTKIHIETTNTTIERDDENSLFAGLPVFWSLIALIVLALLMFTCGVFVHSTLKSETPEASATTVPEPESTPPPEPKPAQEPEIKDPVLRDSDGDGLFDPGQDGVPEESTDQCPQQPGPLKYHGCPPTDQDSDGILDGDDRCPTEPETANGYEDADGCPDELPEPVKSFSGVISGVNFDTNRATLRPGASAILDRAVDVLSRYPELRVEISGHTDSVGTRAHNLELSRARAETVRRYLVKGGISDTRLETAGFGPDRPLDDNRTREGRLRNRRIEFRLLTTSPSVTATP